MTLRIRPLEPPYPDAVQRQFDAIMPPGMPPLLLFRTLAVSERAYERFRGGSLLDRGPLSLRERELIIDRTTARAGCEYEWGVHVAIFAAKVELTDEEVRAICAVPLPEGVFSERERALLAAVDALHERATLSEAEFERLREHLDDAQILELLMLAGFYRTVAYVCNGLDLPLESFGARFPRS